LNTKTVLIVGSVAAGALILYALVKKSTANQAAYLNQPGLENQTGMPAPPQTGFSGILSSILNSGLVSGSVGTLQDAFSSTTDANDPGLESNDATDFSGMDYTYENSNPYQTTDPQAIYDSVN
jgi:hypothetical protein